MSRVDIPILRANMKKTSIIILYFLLPLILLAGSSSREIISRADSAYNEERYADAAGLYESVLDMGLESPELYYNLGNAYFNLHNLPAAILNYERAAILAPRDKDIRFNLNIANSLITDKIETVPEIFYVEWWKSLRGSFNMFTWTRISLLIFALAILFAGVFFLSKSVFMRKFGFWAGTIALLLTIMSFAITYTKYDTISRHLEAIVFSPTITVKSSPNQLGKDLFVIHEGTKVLILEEVNGWANIRIANGSSGWMPLNSVKRI